MYAGSTLAQRQHYHPNVGPTLAQPTLLSDWLGCKDAHDQASTPPKCRIVCSSVVCCNVVCNLVRFYRGSPMTHKGMFTQDATSNMTEAGQDVQQSINIGIRYIRIWLEPLLSHACLQPLCICICLGITSWQNSIESILLHWWLRLSQAVSFKEHGSKKISIHVIICRSSVHSCLPCECSCPLQWHHNECGASQIFSASIVCSNVGSGADQRIHQSSASLAFVRGSHQSLVNSMHKRPVTQKMFPIDDIIMHTARAAGSCISCPECQHIIHSYLVNIFLHKNEALPANMGGLMKW